MPTRTSRRARPMPPEERRAAIVHATVPLVVRHGDAVTVKQVAEASGVAEGTIFNVFDDKDDLLDAVIEAVLDDERFEAAVGAIDADLPFAERLVVATRLLQDRVAEVWQLLSALGHRHHRPRGPMPDSPALAALFAAAPGATSTSPVESARILRALTLSLTHPMLATEPETAERIVHLFLRGVEAGR